jgi:dTDP-glucose 4,6-dehydratase
VHFAAESHVDRSIASPGDFIHTNVYGTFTLLRETLEYWQGLRGEERDSFRFVHISTDEVFGSLTPDGAPFVECSPYQPNSPYAASKAAADHIVRAYHHTYGLPTITSHCTNNYGPFQFPEKLIPLLIIHAYQGRPLPIYGDGLQERNWIHVSDHCAAISRMLDVGRPGAVYMVGDDRSIPNVDVVHAICQAMDVKIPECAPHCDLVKHVADRPGHDRRYDVDSSATRKQLSWSPRIAFARGIVDTVDWYMSNGEWVSGVLSGEYRTWIDRQYGGALN